MEDLLSDPSAEDEPIPWHPAPRQIVRIAARPVPPRPRIWVGPVCGDRVEHILRRRITAIEVFEVRSGCAAWGKARSDIACDIIIVVLGRSTLDTDVLVAALRSDRGASRVLLREAFGRRYAVLVSVPLMLQYEAVVTRPEHLAAAGISEQDAGVLLDTLALVAEPIRISYLWRPLLPDPGDDLVLETAVNGRAAAIVTFNRRHFAPAAARFGPEILSPGEAVQRLEERS